MENFIVSARKYRPQTFDTVVGQSHITSTLKNAIKSSHVAQAYLFCGPRGVGKTTCARILAKTINCTGKTKSIEACDECESCESFNSGHSLNIYELDAASNNSVEDIRNLINQVSFAPQLGSHKVYIIDEVHMLSQQAFNAFLKTLEEPPKHAIFILATTEKHKIIPTILSRCQIFDFNRIKVEDIATRLSLISQHEKVSAEAEALHVISQKADGSLRDALSMFDQMVSLSGDEITYKTVIDNLSILDYEYYFKVTDALQEKNTSSALLLFNEILNKGFDGHHFINGLAEHFRNLLVCRDEITVQLLEVSASIRERYKAQSKKTEADFLLRGLSLLNKSDVQYKVSRNQRLLVELTLLQLCSLQSQGAEKKSELISKTFEVVLPSSHRGDQTVKHVPAEVSKKIITEVKEEPAAYSKTPEPEPLVTSPTQKETPAKSSNARLNDKVGQGKIPIKGKMLSITSMTNGAAAGVKEQKAEYKSNTDVNSTEEITLDAAWKKFAELLKKKNKINLATTLTSHSPAREDASTISFNVANQVQEDEINAIRTDLLTFLRSAMHTPSLTLKIIVDKNDAERKPYTGEEKYKRLSEKNPALNKLRSQFNLEIDY